MDFQEKIFFCREGREERKKSAKKYYVSDQWGVARTEPSLILFFFAFFASFAEKRF